MNRFGGPAIPFQADITKMGDIPKIVDKAIKEYGKIDFLFNNAGKGHPAPPEDYKESDWDEVLTTNLKGPFFLAQAVGRTMISAKRPGSIINTSSIMAFITMKDSPVYPISKAGVSQLTKALANSWAKYGIRVIKGLKIVFTSCRVFCCVMMKICTNAVRGFLDKSEMPYDSIM